MLLVLCRRDEEQVAQTRGGVELRMTFPVIAAVLGRPLSTVHAQYSRAVEKLNAIVARVL